MQVYRPHLISEEEMMKFHADDYVHFLQHVTPDNMQHHLPEMKRYLVDTVKWTEDPVCRYNVDVDCPVFDRLFKYCQT
jgi:acetoin utilization deacetylase AcuC-like enzyme